jgi:hypothetical protein
MQLDAVNNASGKVLMAIVLPPRNSRTTYQDVHIPIPIEIKGGD